MPSVPAVIACVQLVFAGHPTDPAVLRLAAREAADIWRPHGVIVRRADDTAACPIESPVESITIVMSDVAAVSEKLHKPRLGEITFAGDGMPDAEIVIASAYLQQAVERTSWNGQPLANRPETLRRHAAARAIGRVLAHELGHYLLRMPEHGRHGLMRPVYSIPALVEPKTHKYRLHHADAARLRALAARASRSGDGRNRPPAILEK